MRTEKICIIAVRKNKAALQFVPNDLKETVREKTKPAKTAKKATPAPAVKTPPAVSPAADAVNISKGIFSGIIGIYKDLFGSIIDWIKTLFRRKKRLVIVILAVVAAWGFLAEGDFFGKQPDVQEDVAAVEPGVTATVTANNLNFRSGPSTDTRVLKTLKQGNPPDRNWQWKADDFKYSPARSRANPGYIGSYAMDATAMALHCVWTTNSAKGAILKAVNRYGDADSVGSVTGQIAGAASGFSDLPAEWIAAVNKWDNQEIGLRAFRLYHKIWLQNNTSFA
ncbi:hypothetical protein AGMMS50268_01100 [Spirochaetia bacterium]|nr:hypothetical protein AGMMS50268_01100 [Spirochaetia bacterium]